MLRNRDPETVTIEQDWLVMAKDCARNIWWKFPVQSLIVGRVLLFDLCRRI